MHALKTMTYQELATAFSITVGSAKNLVRRKRWTRMTGNDGTARISVPVEEYEQHRRLSIRKSDDGDGNIPTVTAAFDPDTSGSIDTGIVASLIASIKEKDLLIQQLQNARVEMATSVGKNAGRANAEIDARERMIAIMSVELKQLRESKVEMASTLARLDSEINIRNLDIAEKNAELSQLKTRLGSLMSVGPFWFGRKTER